MNDAGIDTNVVPSSLPETCLMEMRTEFFLCKSQKKLINSEREPN